jgi:mannose-6-phosphate isomerase-like protein (cupin superfamily)
MRNDYPDVSIVEIELHGTNKAGRNLECESYYYILDGEGTFTIDGVSSPTKKGDLVYIPKKTAYSDTGAMRMLAIKTPRFSQEQWEDLD